MNKICVCFVVSPEPGSSEPCLYAGPEDIQRRNCYSNVYWSQAIYLEWTVTITDMKDIR